MTIAKPWWPESSVELFVDAVNAVAEWVVSNNELISDIIVPR